PPPKPCWPSTAGRPPAPGRSQTATPTPLSPGADEWLGEVGAAAGLPPFFPFVKENNADSSRIQDSPGTPRNPRGMARTPIRRLRQIGEALGQRKIPGARTHRSLAALAGRGHRGHGGLDRRTPRDQP